MGQKATVNTPGFFIQNLTVVLEKKISLVNCVVQALLG